MEVAIGAVGVREALLRTVCEAPGEHAPWLVLCDWLDEHGEPSNGLRAWLAAWGNALGIVAGPVAETMLEGLRAPVRLPTPAEVYFEDADDVRAFAASWCEAGPTHLNCNPLWGKQ